MSCLLGIDLGTSSDPATGALNGSLYRYKESLGARAVASVFVEYGCDCQVHRQVIRILDEI